MLRVLPSEPKAVMSRSLLCSLNQVLDELYFLVSSSSCGGVKESLLAAQCTTTNTMRLTLEKETSGESKGAIGW